MLTLTMHQLSRVALAAIATSCFSAPGLAQSAKGGGSTGGVIAIDQARADVGGVTDNGGGVQVSATESYQTAGNICNGALCQ
jgi:hypothetical protein